MRALAITGIVTAALMPSIISGSLIRATPPSRRMSAGTRTSAITAHAPESSAILACSGVTTSMMTPPFNISASPRFTGKVPVEREEETAPVMTPQAIGPLPSARRTLRSGQRGRGAAAGELDPGVAGGELDRGAVGGGEVEHVGAVAAGPRAVDRLATRVQGDVATADGLGLGAVRVGRARLVVDGEDDHVRRRDRAG